MIVGEFDRRSFACIFLSKRRYSINVIELMVGWVSLFLGMMVVMDVIPLSGDASPF